MVKKMVLAAAIANVMMVAPVMAQVERHQNPSLNGYSGIASQAQFEQPTAYRTAPSNRGLDQVDAVGSGNPSLESFNPNAVARQPSRVGTVPSVAENPDFSWIDQADVGA